MTQFLPPNLLALFAARDPIPYLPPASKLRHEKHPVGYTGVGAFLSHFEDPSETPPPLKLEKREERLERKRKDKAEQVAYKLEQAIATWNPNTNTGATLDPFRTLFVGRINYDTSESKLRREFDVYGPITKIQMVHNKKTGKPRGYAFVEYEHERDMHSAYKHADGKKIDGRRVLVDVERGRTVKGWLPRRLGGGLGGTRRGGPEVNVKISGREDPDRDRFRDEKPERGRDREGRRERERSREKETDRHRERDRERDKDKDRRRTSRDKTDRIERVERDRGDREERDREREDRTRVERKRRRSRSRDKRDKEGGVPEEEERVRKRSKSRERKRHRSKSRDKDKKKDKRDKDRDRGDRDRDRERKEKGKDRIKVEDMDYARVRVKEEPVDDYPQFDNYANYDGYNVKSENDTNGENNGDAEYAR